MSVEAEMRIFKNAWFDRFARKQDIGDRLLLDAVRRVESGQKDADLGAGVLKLRIARSGEGRSGGFRTVVFYRKGQRAFFVFGFARSDRGNINADEVAAFKQAAKHVLALSDTQLADLVAAGAFVEIL